MRTFFLGPVFSELFPLMDHPVVSNGPVDPANHIQHLVKGAECLEGGIERPTASPLSRTAAVEKANSWASAEHRSESGIIIAVHVVSAYFPVRSLPKPPKMADRRNRK